MLPDPHLIFTAFVLLSPAFLASRILAHRGQASCSRIRDLQHTIIRLSASDDSSITLQRNSAEFSLKFYLRSSRRPEAHGPSVNAVVQADTNPRTLKINPPTQHYDFETHHALPCYVVHCTSRLATRVHHFACTTTTAMIISNPR